MTGSINDNQLNTIKEAVQRFVDARLQGQEPDIDEFLRQYPGLEDQVRQGIEDMLKIDSLFDSLVEADEQDFEETAMVYGLTGHKIGSFEIVEMIGRGGMGVVYLANDTKLERQVAIKSLPPEVMDNPQVRSRLKREAKLLASLNHPNIATIHDVIEEESGAGYLVLEYVSGDTLGDRIKRGRLELKEALHIARQVAEGIAAAHERGVIHRDLKPGNIKITPEGRAKILDFGLAKTLSREATDQQTTITEPGKVIGTPGYMSPEQARGRPTDQRTDIWSFGCVLYEMLSGRMPFQGETVSDTLANILNREPDWDALPAETPDNIKVLLRRCLQKDPRQRLQHIGDARIEIGETLTMSVTGRSPAAHGKLRMLATTALAVAITALLAIAVWFFLNRPARHPSKLTMLVVMPFETLGPSANEWFADGITDAITTRLNGIRELGVISHQAAMQYKDSKMTLQEIARKLLVAYLVVGCVQYERASDPNSPVRITPRLIRVSDFMEIWADSYDDYMDQPFRVQSDVAEKVVRALDIALREPERRALASIATKNRDAYFLYQQGKEHFYNDWRGGDVEKAIEKYEAAIKLDEDFSLAWAWLSQAQTTLYWRPKEGDTQDKRAEYLQKGKESAEKAILLDKELPDAHLAMGKYYYHGLLDYDRAMREFKTVLRHRPNDPQALYLAGCVYRRQGDFANARKRITSAAQLDPRPMILGDLQQTLFYMGLYDEAEDTCNRNILLHPDNGVLRVHKAMLYLQGMGDTKKTLEVVKEAERDIPDTDPNTFAHIRTEIALYEQDFAEALKWRTRSPYSGDSQYPFMPKELQFAEIHRYLNNENDANYYFATARDILEKKKNQDPNDARFHSALGIAYAGLDNETEAIKEGKKGVELMPENIDAMQGRNRLVLLAQIYVMVGQNDLALKELEHLLSVPSELSPTMLERDPVWGPLRERADFKKLVKRAKQADRSKVR